MKALPTLICLALCPAALSQSVFRTVTVADSDSGNATLPMGTHTSFSSPGSRAIATVDFALPDAPGAEQVQLDYTATIEGNIFIDLLGLASPHTDIDGSFNETTGVCDTFCNWGPSDSLQGFHPTRVYGLALGELRTSILNSRAWGCNGRCSFSGTLTPADASWTIMQASPNLMAVREIRDVFFDARNGASSTDVELRSFDVATYASVSVTNTFELSTIPLTQFCTSQQSSSGVPATIEAYGAPVDGSEWVTVRALGLPSNSFSVLFVGDQQANQPGATTTVCVGGSIRRQGGVQLASTGTADFEIDLLGRAVGQTIVLQAFFRDPSLGIAATNGSMFVVQARP